FSFAFSSFALASSFPFSSLESAFCPQATSIAANIVRRRTLIHFFNMLILSFKLVIMHKNMQNFAITYQISYFFPFILSKKDVLISKNILYNSFRSEERRVVK